MSDEKRVLTVGRLDGLMITPIVGADGDGFLRLTVDTLPGLRLDLEIAAAREMHEALGIILRMPASLPPAPSETEVCNCGRARGAGVHEPGALNGHEFDPWVEG